MEKEPMLEEFLERVAARARKRAPVEKKGLISYRYLLHNCDPKTLRGLCQNAAMGACRDLKETTLDYLPLGVVPAVKSGTHAIVAVCDKNGDISYIIDPTITQMPGFENTKKFVYSVNEYPIEVCAVELLEDNAYYED